MAKTSKPSTSTPKAVGKLTDRAKPKSIDKPATKAKSKAGTASGAASKPATKAKPKAGTASGAAGKPAGKAKPKNKGTSTGASGKPASKSKSKPIVKKTAKATAFDAFKKVSAKIAEQEMRLLCQKYPEAECELDYSSNFQLLTAVIMSAQTTDVTVNNVTKTLFERFPDANSLAEADIDEIKEIIRTTGYYNAKAANIQNCAKALVENFGGKVPATMDELITLPGVGRKTANVVLGVAFGVPGWTVDTHVQRLSLRLGFSAETDPEKIEVALQKLFPHQDWSKHSITLIWHGRRTCFARKPDCQKCPINHLCPSAEI